MAELSDIRLALANIVSNAVYPNGTTQPSAIPGLTGFCAIYINDPKPDDIDTRLAAGDVLISVVEYGDAKPAKRYPVATTITNRPLATLVWSVNVPTVTLSGLVSVPQNVALIVDGADFLYQVQSSDTLAGIAAAFVGLIAPVRPANASGATVTIPNAHTIVARVGVVSQTVKEIGRQESRFRVSVWAARETQRIATVNVVRGALDDLRRFSLPEGTVANIRSGVALPVYDPLKLGISRTNIAYPVDFPVIVSGTAAQAIVWRTTWQGAAAPYSAFTSSDPPPRIIEA